MSTQFLSVSSTRFLRGFLSERDLRHFCTETRSFLEKMLDSFLCTWNMSTRFLNSEKIWVLVSYKPASYKTRGPRSSKQPFKNLWWLFELSCPIRKRAQTQIQFRTTWPIYSEILNTLAWKQILNIFWQFWPPRTQMGPQTQIMLIDLILDEHSQPF